MTNLKIENVSKRFGKLEVLNQINLDFSGPKIYGLLGRNGAGKTTLINIITQKITANNGEVFLNGQKVSNCDGALQQISSMVVQDLLYDKMKITELLNFSRKMYKNFDMEYAQKLMDKFQLNPKMKVGSLSTGYRGILKIILTMASGAPILIFDEPVLGLDANHRDLFYRELITLYSRRPCIIILSTHLIEEIDKVIEEVAIIKDDENLVTMPVDKLLEQAYRVSGPKETVTKFIKGKRVIESQEVGKYLIATLFEPKKDEDEGEANDLGLTFEPVELQQLFIHLTNS